MIGQALDKMKGRLWKVAFFVMILPYGDGAFMMAFERECTEAFWELEAKRPSYRRFRASSSRLLGSGSYQAQTLESRDIYDLEPQTSSTSQVPNLAAAAHGFCGDE